MGTEAKTPVCTKANHTHTSTNRALIRKWLPPPPQPGSLEFLPPVTISSQRISELKMNCDFMCVSAACVSHGCCWPGQPQVLWDTLFSSRACPGECRPPVHRLGSRARPACTELNVVCTPRLWNLPALKPWMWRHEQFPITYVSLPGTPYQKNPT